MIWIFALLGSISMRGMFGMKILPTMQAENIYVKAEYPIIFINKRQLVTYH